jgi:hypothetical protein
MFTHIGLLGLGSVSPIELDAITTGLTALVSEVPGLRSMETFVDAGLGGEVNASIGFIATFEDEGAWRAYGSHPQHLDLIGTRIAPVLVSRTFVQARQPGPSASC